MDLNTLKSKFTDEQIDEIIEYQDMIKKAKPYSQDELAEIPLDSCDFDMDRIAATNAENALKKLGIIK